LTVNCPLFVRELVNFGQKGAKRAKLRGGISTVSFHLLELG
jgi:hypothetical protein